MKLMIMSLSIMTSTLFILMKHPLSMGFMLLMQTLMVCLMNGLNNYSYWFSYVLFITFVGGLMVLFIYIASIAANEKFIFSLKVTIIIMMIMLTTIMLINYSDYTSSVNELLNYYENSKTNNKEMFSIMKMYNLPTSMITILTVIHLLFTMITVIKVTNISEGPLRPKN